MNLGMQANIGQTQEQTLSPALLQSVKMLQKTSQELETAIKEEVEVNPLLEVDLFTGLRMRFITAGKNRFVDFWREFK